jgi:hypothetical protein
MDKHFRILGYLFIVYGILTLGTLAAIFYLPEVAPAKPEAGRYMWLAITFSVLLSLFYVFTGWALLNRLSWTREVVIVASVIALFNFPLGTALGIYGLWVTFSSAGQQEFGPYIGRGGTTQTPV